MDFLLETFCYQIDKGKKVKKKHISKIAKFFRFFPQQTKKMRMRAKIPIPIIITIWEQKAGGGVIRPTFGTSRRRRTSPTKRR